MIISKRALDTLHVLLIFPLSMSMCSSILKLKVCFPFLYYTYWTTNIPMTTITFLPHSALIQFYVYHQLCRNLFVYLHVIIFYNHTRMILPCLSIICHQRHSTDNTFILHFYLYPIHISFSLFLYIYPNTLTFPAILVSSINRLHHLHHIKVFPFLSTSVC